MGKLITLVLLALSLGMTARAQLIGGGGGPCVLSGSQTSGYVLTATDGARGCSWQTVGGASVDANTIRNAVYCPDTSGSANTITCAPTTTFPSSYAAGQAVWVLVANSNSGAATINVKSLGAKAVTKNGATALASGNLIANHAYLMVYDGTQFQVLTYTPLAADIPTLAPLASPAFTGTVSATYLTVVGLSYPIIGITNGGTSGITTYAYCMVGTDAAGGTRSVCDVTVTGNATLSATNYNAAVLVAWSGTVLPVGTCSVYRIIGGATQGKIGTLASCAAGGSFNDTGLSGDGTSPPTDTSGVAAAAETSVITMPTTTGPNVGVIYRSGGQFGWAGRVPLMHTYFSGSPWLNDMNFFAGQGAGNFTLTGTALTGIGLDALTANSSGNNNTAIGSGAMFSNTTGSDNTALGTNALSIATASTGNTALGFSAMGTATGGTNNVAIGPYALLANTTGQGNVAIGNLTLTANMANSNNVAVGNGALTYSTSDGLIAIGTSALNANTTGTYNSAIGFGALVLNSSGTYNTAIGPSALGAVQTGSYNMAIGPSALNSATGSSNTGIGLLAGTTITSGSSNTVIGSQADVAAAADTNETVIGASAKGIGSNSIQLGTSATTKLGVGSLSWTFASGSPDGSCANGSIYTATNGTTSDLLWVCGSSVWQLTPSGSGNTTSTSLTTNTLPKANGANSIIDSSISDNGTTVSTSEPISSGGFTSAATAAGTLSLTNNATPGSVVANSWGWTAPATVTTSWYGESPNAVPTANQIMVFPVPTGNVSQWAWMNYSLAGMSSTFSSPLSLSTNTVTCPTCVVASSPGVGLAHFAGSTQTVTSSAIATGDIAANAVTSAKLAVVNTYRTCDIPVGDTSASALTNGQLGPQSRVCYIPAAATIVEMDVNADAGTPNIILGRNHAGTIANIVSGALATAASGGIACTNTGGTTGLNGATTCSSTLQNTSLSAGDYLELVSGTAGGTAKFFVAHVIYTVN